MLFEKLNVSYSYFFFLKFLRKMIFNVYLILLIKKEYNINVFLNDNC